MNRAPLKPIVRLDTIEQARTALRQELTYTGAPAALRARVIRALDQEVSTTISAKEHRRTERILEDQSDRGPSAIAEATVAKTAAGSTRGPDGSSMTPAETP
jgi:hypothetical protein